ncbi:MAG TPA: polyphosphate polymerase domain-containing protein [Aeromicrobium sp.]|nr:polyphosphate polymerase domain-containing protein [Aeromicrobium sp.]
MTALATEVRVWEGLRPDQVASEAMVGRLDLDMLQPVGLDTLVEHAELMQRTDRKYIASVEAVRQLVAAIGDTHQVLAINDRRYTTYRTLYFDTVDFASARAHVQRRRQRWKVRSRLYVEDQLARVEVKTKDNRGNTAKVMGISHPDYYGALIGDDHDFVARHLSDFPDVRVRDLVPAGEVRYTRSTLSDLTAGTRVTIDWGLSMHLANGDVWLDDDYATVETKGPLALSSADKALHALGLRPRGFSKYVAATSTLVPDIPSNDFASLRAGEILHSRVMEA